MNKAFPAKIESVAPLVEYVGAALEKEKVNPKLSYEYQLLVEEIVYKLVDHARPKSEITVEIFKRLGGLNIYLTCPGKAVVLAQEDEFDLGGKIIESFSDYLRQSYSAGVNRITFASTTTESNRFLLFTALSIALSVIAAVVLKLFCTAEQLSWLDESIVYPVVCLFTRCMQTMATPVAFFSLAAFLVTLRQSLTADRRLIQISVRNFLVSLIALGIGFVVWQIYKVLDISLQLPFSKNDADYFIGNKVSDFLDQIVANNIIDPFKISNPIPMLVIGVLLGIAAGDIFGPEGEGARRGIASINGLFCKMTDLVYNTIPIFMFFSLLSGWMQTGFVYFFMLIRNLLLFIPAIFLLLVVYVFELLIAGVSPLRFFLDYKDVLWENLKIGSNLNALPYNKRMLHRKTKIPRDLLDAGLQLGGLMNMDGNCIMVSTGIMGMLISTGVSMTTVEFFMLVFVSILLSVGAPNQPGSFLLSIIVLMSLVGINGNLYADLLVVEALFGKVYSCLNAVGDIVTMVTVGEQLKRDEKPQKD